MTRIDSALFWDIRIRKLEGYAAWLNRLRVQALIAGPVVETVEEVERGRWLADSFLGDEQWKQQTLF